MWKVEPVPIPEVRIFQASVYMHRGKPRNTYVRKASVKAEICKRDLLKAKQESYPLSREDCEGNLCSKKLGTTFSSLGLL